MLSRSLSAQRGPSEYIQRFELLVHPLVCLHITSHRCHHNTLYLANIMLVPIKTLRFFSLTYLRIESRSWFTPSCKIWRSLLAVFERYVTPEIADDFSINFRLYIRNILRLSINLELTIVDTFKVLARLLGTSIRVPTTLETPLFLPLSHQIMFAESTTMLVGKCSFQKTAQ